MAKLYLNQDDKDAIADAITQHKYGPLARAADEVGKGLFNDLYEHIYSATERRLLDSLPKGLATETGVFIVAVGGQQFWISAKGDTSNYIIVADEAKITRVRVWAMREKRIDLAADHLLGERLVAWRDGREQMSNDRREQRRKVKSTLNTWRYFEDAVKGWPEAETFIRERWLERGDGPTNLPAIQIADLSRALDLPPTK